MESTTNSEQKETGDSIVASVVEKFQERSRTGIQKYGTTLDRTDLTTSEWIRHAQEEHMDAILYLERLQKEVSQKDAEMRDLKKAIVLKDRNITHRMKRQAELWRNLNYIGPHFKRACTDRDYYLFMFWIMVFIYWVPSFSSLVSFFSR